MRVGLEYGEFDVDHDIKVLFIDEDGKELGKQEGKLSVPRPEKGGELYADLILPIDNLILEKPGRYEFRLIINRESKRTIPIDVIQINSDTTRD